MTDDETPNPPPPTAGSDAVTGWQRVHPLTPLASLRILPMLVGGYVVHRFWNRGLNMLGFQEAESDADDPDPWSVAVSLVREGGSPLVLAGVAVIVVMSLWVTMSWLSWRRAMFRLRDDTFESRRGLLFRSHRQVKAPRIQAVEIHRGLGPRMLGLAALDIQSAGGLGSNVILKFVPHAQALALRDELLSLAADADDEVDLSDSTSDDVVAGPDQRREAAGAALVRIPNARAVKAVLYTPMTPIVALVLLAGASVLVAKGLLLFPGLAAQPLLNRVSDLALPLAVPLSLAFGSVAHMWSTVRRTGGTTIEATPAGARVVSGLLGSTSTTIPRQRVQAIELTQGMLYRRLGWWRVVVHTAASGASGGDAKPGTTPALPVGTFAEALAVIRQLDPRLDLDLVRVAAEGEGGESGWYGTAPAGKVFEPLQYRRHAIAVTPHAAYVREGRLGRSVLVLPQARIQVVTLDQGPLARRRGLAAVLLHGAKGPGAATMRNLTVSQAEELFARESDLTSDARAEARAAQSA